MTTLIASHTEAPAAPVVEPARPTAAWWAALGETPSHATITGAFYAVCLVAAVFGQSLVGTAVLGLALWFAMALAVALELAGVKFAYDAAVARAAGEHAIVPQALSYVVAVVAVGTNVFGHLVMGDVFGAAVFGLFSALAFVAFTIRAEFRRRQADRAAGKAAHPTPAYGVRRWVTQRAVTARAKALAAADPELGLYGSLSAAEAALAAESRRAELADLLTRKALADFGGDKLRAAIEVAKYDLDRIAAELCSRADHTAAVTAIEADLDANRAAPATARTATTDTAASTSTPPAKPRRTRAGTAKRGKGKGPSDAALVDRIRAIEADTGKPVSINRARTALGIGTDRARRVLAIAAESAPVPAAEAAN